MEIVEKAKEFIEKKIRKVPEWPKKFSESEFAEIQNSIEQDTEKRIYANLNLLELFTDEVEAGIFAKIMPYVGAILSVITLIAVIMKK